MIMKDFEELCRKWIVRWNDMDAGFYQRWRSGQGIIGVRYELRVGLNIVTVKWFVRSNDIEAGFFQDESRDNRLARYSESEEGKKEVGRTKIDDRMVEDMNMWLGWDTGSGWLDDWR